MAACGGGGRARRRAPAREWWRCVVTREAAMPAAVSAVGGGVEGVRGRGEHDVPGWVRLVEPGGGGLLESGRGRRRRAHADRLSSRIDPMSNAVEAGRPVSDVGLEPGALEMGGDRVARRDVSVRLGVAAGGRVGVGAPVVEDPGDVGDPVGALDQPQDHVDVLGPVELGAKAADLRDAARVGRPRDGTCSRWCAACRVTSPA